MKAQQLDKVTIIEKEDSSDGSRISAAIRKMSTRTYIVFKLISMLLVYAFRSWIPKDSK